MCHQPVRHRYYGFIRRLIQITLLERESMYASALAYVSAPSRGATRDALLWLSHTGYTSPTFIHSIESGNPEPCRVLIQFHGRR
jgi:hypothetical protein